MRGTDMKTERHNRRSVRRLAMATAMGAALLTVGGCRALLDTVVPGHLGFPLPDSELSLLDKNLGNR